MGGEALKKSIVFEWYKQFKESPHVKITNEDNAPCFFTLNSFHKASQPNLLCGNTEMVT